MTNKVLITYLIYLPIVLALTWATAHTLFRNARMFMLDIFNGQTEIAASTTRLFETGFYLVNTGFALWMLQTYADIDTNQHVLEVLASKVGGFAIYLGIMLFLNMYLFFRGRAKSREMRALRQATMPVITNPAQ